MSLTGDAAAKGAGAALEAVFAGLKVVRPDRPIHAEGVWLEGTLTHSRAFSGEDWLDGSELKDEPVTARVSRSVGLPEALPDVIGLGLRIGGADVLLSTTGHGLPGRFLLAPRRSLAEGPFTSIMPFRGVGGPVLLAVKREGPGLPFSRLADLTAYDGELNWGMYYSRLRDPWTRFAGLQLRVRADQGQQFRFDPVGRPPAGLEAYEWTRRLRIPSYRLAQKGQHGYTSRSSSPAAERDLWKPITSLPRKIRSRKT